MLRKISPDHRLRTSEARGFALCRRTDGSWGGPAAIRFGGGSFGAQIGAESTDVVMLVMNHDGMEKLAGDKFTIGGDASALRDRWAGQVQPIRTSHSVRKSYPTLGPGDRAILNGEVRPPEAARGLVSELDHLLAGDRPKLANTVCAMRFLDQCRCHLGPGAGVSCAPHSAAHPPKPHAKGSPPDRHFRPAPDPHQHLARLRLLAFLRGPKTLRTHARRKVTHSPHASYPAALECSRQNSYNRAVTAPQRSRVSMSSEQNIIFELHFPCSFR